MALIIGWPNLADTATLSGGSWLAALGLAKLQTDALSAVARSTTDANADTIINVDHGAAKAVSIVALTAHNLRSAATWRIRGSAASDMSGAVYDSGTISCWPVQWPTGLLPAGHPNASTRLLTDAQINALNPPRDVVHVLATEATARYWRIELFDSTNADTYVQIGRLTMAPRYTPSNTMSVGASFGFDAEDGVGRSLSRSKFFDVKPRGRLLTATFPNLTDDEAGAVLRDMVEDRGVNGQLYVVTDANDTYDLQRRSFLATLRQLSPVERAAAGRSAMTLTFEEVR